MKASLCLIIAVVFLGSRCAAGGDQKNPDTAVFKLNFDPFVSETTIIGLITDARKTIDISLYEFDIQSIASALVTAYQRQGVQIRMSTDYDSESQAGYQTVINAGIPVKLGNDAAIMHDKYILVDKKYVVTGSTNLKGTAPPTQLNPQGTIGYPTGMYAHYNNLIVTKSESLVAEFQKDFEVQWNGYYGNKKDTGYAALYGSNPWTETQYTIGPYKVNAFFTAYQNTFPSYQSRYPGDPDCSSVGVTTTSSSTIDAACVTPPAAFAAVNYCYDTTNTRTIYRHYNADSGAYQCKGSSASYNDYRSALNVVMQMLRGAKKSILILAFAFTDRVIMNELKNAKARGVDVKVYMDYNQYRSNYRNSGNSFVDLRQNVGFVKLTRRYNSGLLHHKVIAVDRDKLILGSMNYSAAAVTANDENFLYIQNAGPLVQQMEQEAANIDLQSFYLPPVPDDGSYISDPGD